MAVGSRLTSARPDLILLNSSVYNWCWEQGSFSLGYTYCFEYLHATEHFTLPHKLREIMVLGFHGCMFGRQCPSRVPTIEHCNPYLEFALLAFSPKKSAIQDSGLCGTPISVSGGHEMAIPSSSNDLDSQSLAVLFVGYL